MSVAVIDVGELEAMVRRVVDAAVKAYLKPEAPELLSTKQLSGVLGISEDVLRHYVRTTPDFPHVRVGRKKLRFRLADVLRWFEEQEAA
jgi:predicted DNA-binding transcriptional regulator AlpA